jgi:hypothetical protein
MEAIIWLVLTSAVTFTMWAAQVAPRQAASNLSAWAALCGIHDPPQWLRNRATDRRVKITAYVALLLLAVWGGILLDQNWPLFPISSSQIETLQPPVRVYSSAEKDELLNATRQIVNLIDTRGDDVFAHIESALRAWGEVYNSSDISKIPNLITNLDELVDVTSNFRDALTLKNGTPLDRYRSYSTEIEFILSLPKKWQDNPIESLYVVSERSKYNFSVVERATKYSPDVLRQLLDLVGVSQLQNAEKNFRNWMTDTKKRAETLRTAVHRN